MIKPPIWSKSQLERGRIASTEGFRKSRLEEPLEAYLDQFEEYQGVVEELLEATVDLTQLRQNALAILSDSNLASAMRYLAGPPISTDDLIVVAEVESLNPNRLKGDPEIVRRIADLIMVGLDRRRFPWVSEGREPTEKERFAAVIASSALMATQRVGTKRRHQGKKEQEQAVEGALQGAGLQKVGTRKVLTLANAPGPGEFCRESLLGDRKADFLVRLWDQRIMAIECKVSNSSTNSVKRLNNDAAAKAEAWIADFGRKQVVPAAVLGGVYKLHNLQSAQERGLCLFWAHDLKAMVTWIDRTRTES